MTRTLTILGCGSSGGVPRIGNHWGQCDPANPKNRRRRCSVLLRQNGHDGETCVLIDTSPDLREQMLEVEVGWINGVLFTHEHADHTHGIDEFRAFYINQRKRMPVWADDGTGTLLLGRFNYCFYSPPGSDYPPILNLTRIVPEGPVEISGAGGTVEALPFEVEHGSSARSDSGSVILPTRRISTAFRMAASHLEGLDLWIVDALRRDPHPSHFSLPETLAWIERLKPKRAVLTNMHIDLDYDVLRCELPKGIEPAYDGMILPI